MGEVIDIVVIVYRSLEWLSITCIWKPSASIDKESRHHATVEHSVCFDSNWCNRWTGL